MLKMAVRNFLPRNIESLRMHLGKKFLATIFSVIVYFKNLKKAMKRL